MKLVKQNFLGGEIGLIGSNKGTIAVLGETPPLSVQI